MASVQIATILCTMSLTIFPCFEFIYIRPIGLHIYSKGSVTDLLIPSSRTLSKLEVLYSIICSSRVGAGIAFGIFAISTRFLAVEKG